MKFVLITDPLSALTVRKKLASTIAIDARVSTFTALIGFSELWLVPSVGVIK